MRILTVRQPWAWAIIHGGKDVENRVRSLGPYRGLVAIHAGLSIDYEAAELSFPLRRAWHDAGLPQHMRGGLGHPILREFEDEDAPWMPTGSVIGVVDLVDVHPATGDGGCFVHEHSHPYTRDRYCSPWAQPNMHHLELANPRPLARPIPATGRLGLWRPGADLETAIRDQLDGGA